MTTNRTSIDDIQFNVFNELVASDDDFMGLLAYSLYKRHKIEWIRSHDDNDDHTAFKRIACTPQQIRMYRDQAELLAKTSSTFRWIS